MRVGRFIARLFSKRQSFQSHPCPPTRFQLEQLESRDLLSVTLNFLGTSFNASGGKDLLVPLTGTDSANAAITYSAQSDNAGVTTSIISSGTTLDINVSGKDMNGSDF